MKRDLADKRQNLIDAEFDGARMSEFADDPAIAGFFAALERDCLDAMLADQTHIVDHLATIRVARRLQVFMRSAKAGGAQAARKLVELVSNG